MKFFGGGGSVVMTTNGGLGGGRGLKAEISNHLDDEIFRKNLLWICEHYSSGKTQSESVSP